MIDALLRLFTGWTLALRYRIRVSGLDAIDGKSPSGILFLSNHPALIDPIVLMSVLHGRFQPRALADQAQIDRFFIRWMAKRAAVVAIPTMAKNGPDSRRAIEIALEELAACLRRGENVLLYPAGRLMRERLEDLGGNSAVETLLQAVPNIRVVTVRIRGLWGSRFSWAYGRSPSVSQTLGKGIRSLLASGVFFAHRRKVTIEFAEDPQMPRPGRGDDRNAINRYLETFYNQEAPYNTFVPCSIWKRGGPRRMPEPQRTSPTGQLERVPGATREIVMEFLEQLSGIERISDEDQLARDLGLDSLARSELLTFLAEEFGFPQGNVDSLRTVGDVLLAACGEAVGGDHAEVVLNPIGANWFVDPPGRPVRDATLAVPHRSDGQLPRTVLEAFLLQARREPGRVIIADQTSGTRTYRDLVVAVMALRREFAKLPGRRTGVMLPASVAADVVYLAMLAAGKTPVMVNWTTGQRNIRSSLDAVGVECVVTAAALVEAIESQGVEFGQIKQQFLYLENVAKGVSKWAKLRAAVTARTSWRSLVEADVSDTAVILFTSGSETTPKAVPLSHENVLRNLDDALKTIRLRPSDRMLGFLPPFHSFGLTVGMLGALCGGLRTVYHANPNDSAVLARLVEAYNVSILVGTPTFLNGIVRASTKEMLTTLRLAVTGAEKCSPHVYSILAEQCPKAVVIEGYGVTECSPMVSINDGNAPRHGTIGKVFPSFEYVIVNDETSQPVETDRCGVLLVRGPCVFGGYLNYDGPSPFVEFGGKRWYRTGDLVSEDTEGVLTFRGRLKRFVKIGGEMISLPAIEAVLELLSRAKSSAENEGKCDFAVEAAVDEHRCELVLFVAKDGSLADVTREEVNRHLREKGLSPLHNIRRVIAIDEIPVLGTGKVDHRRLAQILAAEA